MTRLYSNLSWCFYIKRGQRFAKNKTYIKKLKPLDQQPEPHWNDLHIIIQNQTGQSSTMLNLNKSDFLGGKWVQKVK